MDSLEGGIDSASWLVDSTDRWDVAMAGDDKSSEKDTRHMSGKVEIKGAISIFDRWEEVVYKKAVVETLAGNILNRLFALVIISVPKTLPS